MNESDESACKSVAKSIADILKFSFDEKFRRHSFKLFDVLSASQIESKIQIKLLNIINGTQKCCNFKGKAQSSRKNLGKGINVGETSRCSTSHLTSSNSTFCFYSYTPDSLQSAPKRSWLQISAEKYKLCLEQSKFKKHCSFSQPEAVENDKQHETISERFNYFDEHWGTSCTHENNLSIDWGTNHYYNRKKLFNDSNEQLIKKFKSNSSCHF